MAVYLKKFDTHAEYENYINGSGAILPNVSICTTEGDVHYNPYVDPYNGHEYVEIGGLKWATMNIGANSITDTGLYFQWGDTKGYTADQVGSGEGKKYFGWEDYKYNSGGTSPSATDMTKYNNTDHLVTLEASDDAAQANWGGLWRMPTTEEWQTLGAAVTTAWTKVNNVYGMLCKDKTDSSKTLFFPVGGFCRDGNVYQEGTDGYYWSSSLRSSAIRQANFLLYNIGNVYWRQFDTRSHGRFVRGVVS